MTDEQEVTAYRAGLQSALTQIGKRMIEVDNNAKDYNLDSKSLSTALFGIGIAMNVIEDMLRNEG